MDDGFYARSFDYIEIVKNERRYVLKIFYKLAILMQRTLFII